MPDCVFCDIVAGTSPASVVHADDDVVAFMDILPVNPGHTLVIPRAHATYLADLPPETAGALMAVAHRIALAIQHSPLRADGLNLFLADGEAAGQEVFHVHLHVTPRTVGDGMSLHVDYDPAPARTALDDHAARIADAMTGEDRSIVPVRTMPTTGRLCPSRTDPPSSSR